MLKAYYVCDSPDSSSSKPVQPAVSSVAAEVLKSGWDLEEEKEDGLELRHMLQQYERLCNSGMLKKLPSQMEHLDNDQTNDVILLINRFLNVFHEVPSRTSILEHDVDVGNAAPIRQHPY